MIYPQFTKMKDIEKHYSKNVSTTSSSSAVGNMGKTGSLLTKRSNQYQLVENLRTKTPKTAFQDMPVSAMSTYDQGSSDAS